MAHFPGFRPLIKDMLHNNIDREHFSVCYAQTIFDVIISLDTTPFEILIGGRFTRWACVMSITDDFELYMPDDKFYQLRNNLDLKGNGIEKFGSYLFIKYIADHAPMHCSRRPIDPAIMQHYYKTKVQPYDDEQRTVFYRWVNQSSHGRSARNFDKTEAYFGKAVANYCRRHNISSQWITPEQALTMHRKSVSFPWE